MLYVNDSIEQHSLTIRLMHINSNDPLISVSQTALLITTLILYPLDIPHMDMTLVTIY